MPTPIQKLFAQVPHSYERINHILTWGLDRLWRRRAVGWAVSEGGAVWMDVCSGTGETAALLVKKASPDTAVLAVDFSLPMLAEIDGKPEAGHIRRVAADVRRLPLPDGSVDLITLSFATRNLNLDRDTLVRTFAEFRRVLRPGGRFINLETSQPSWPPFRWAVHRYIGLAVKPVGALLSGSPQAYAYLSQTIPRFYAAEALAQCLRDAGFSTVSYRRLLGGVAAMHRAQV